MQNTNNLPDMTPASRELINMSSPASSSDTISVAQQAATPPSVPTSAQRAAQLSECFSSIAEQLAHASSLFALPPISVAVESSTGTPQFRADIDAVQRLLAGAQLVDARPGPSEADLSPSIFFSDCSELKWVRTGLKPGSPVRTSAQRDGGHTEDADHGATDIEWKTTTEFPKYQGRVRAPYQCVSVPHRH